MKNLGCGYYALCLIVIVLAVYYPAISAPLNPVDDRAIVNWLYNLEGSALKDIFVNTTDYFYRPVLLVTYLLDKYLWGAETSFMHLENVIIHSVNTILLFGAVSIIFTRLGHESRWLPFSSALLFALHPLNTESVNWIAGRSDLLAGFFVLLSCWLLLRGLERNRPFFAYLSFLALLPGAFSKETAVFFIPAAIIIIICFPNRLALENSELWYRIKGRFSYMAPFIAAPLFFVAVRFMLLLSRDTGVTLARKFISGNKIDILSILKTVLTGIGFYAKKLILPWPLNFTIFHVPDQYFWAGLFLLPVLCYWVYRQEMVGALFLMTACIGFSAILVMLLRPAWTPVAERYMYIPSAFFCMAITIVGYRILLRIPYKQFTMGIAGVFFAATAYATVDRNLVWQDNIRLFQDTVSKSPDFPFARSVLADLLRESGRSAEGKALIQSNRAPDGLRNADYLDLKRALLLLEEGKPAEARALILEKRRKTGQLYHTFHKLLIKVDEQLMKTCSESEKHEILGELISLNKDLYDAYKDPFYYYRIGHLYMQIPDRESAARYFGLAFHSAPAQAFYKQPAGKLAERLSKR